MNTYFFAAYPKTARRIFRVSVIAALWATPLFAQEEDVVASGKYEFRQHCAVCHGVDGKGESIMKNLNLLIERPPDLTQLKKHNGGAFPFWQVYRIIDGRQPVTGHGAPDMPVWGDLLSMQEERASGLSAETKTTGRILNIVHYLQSLQAK